MCVDGPNGRPAEICLECDTAQLTSTNPLSAPALLVFEGNLRASQKAGTFYLTADAIRESDVPGAQLRDARFLKSGDCDILRPLSKWRRVSWPVP